MHNRTEQGHEKYRITCISKTNRTAILHVPMGRGDWENSTSKLDNDAERVVNINMDLP